MRRGRLTASVDRYPGGEGVANEPIFGELHDELMKEAPNGKRMRALVGDLAANWTTVPPERVVLHPLGFFYFPLQRADGRTLRLHVWHDEHRTTAPKTSPYHAHAWTLRSHVLSGSVTNEMPELVCSGVDPDYRLYDITGDSVTDTMTPTRVTVRFRPGSSDTYARGDTYSMSAGEFHSTDCPKGELAATLCVVEQVPGTSEITLGPLEPSHLTDVRREAESSMARDVIASVHRAMSE